MTAAVGLDVIVTVLLALVATLEASGGPHRAAAIGVATGLVSVCDVPERPVTRISSSESRQPFLTSVRFPARAVEDMNRPPRQLRTSFSP